MPYLWTMEEETFISAMAFGLVVTDL